MKTEKPASATRLAKRATAGVMRNLGDGTFAPVVEIPLP